MTVSEAELRLYMQGKGPVCDFLCRTVMDAFRDPAAEIAMMKLLRTSSLAENMDQPESYLERFTTEKVAWSRIIWDISAIAALKNPNWTPSKLIPAPGLTDDFHWVPRKDSSHLIRQVTYCYRNLIFGDLFAALAGK